MESIEVVILLFGEIFSLIYTSVYIYLWFSYLIEILGFQPDDAIAGKYRK